MKIKLLITFIFLVNFSSVHSLELPEKGSFALSVPVEHGGYTFRPRYYLSDTLLIGGELGFNVTDNVTSFDSGDKAIDSGNLKIIGLNARKYFGDKRFKLFNQVSFLFVDMNSEYTRRNSDTTYSAQSERRYFNLDYLLGAEYFFNNKLSAEAGIKFNVFKIENREDAGDYRKTYHTFTQALSLTYHF